MSCFNVHVDARLPSQIDQTLEEEFQRPSSEEEDDQQQQPSASTLRRRRAAAFVRYNPRRAYYAQLAVREAYLAASLWDGVHLNTL